MHGQCPGSATLPKTAYLQYLLLRPSRAEARHFTVTLKERALEVHERLICRTLGRRGAHRVGFPGSRRQCLEERTLQASLSAPSSLLKSRRKDLAACCTKMASAPSCTCCWVRPALLPQLCMPSCASLDAAKASPSVSHCLLLPCTGTGVPPEPLRGEVGGK